MTAPSSRARILRGYGPILAFALFFTLVAAFVPTVGQEVRTAPAALPAAPSPAGGESLAASPESAPGRSDGVGGTGTTPETPGTGGHGRAPVQVRVGREASSEAAAGLPRAPGAIRGPAAAAGAAPQGVRSCGSRARQVPNDPYSPPCLAFSGDNGGATSRGVTAARILLSARLFHFPEFSFKSDDGADQSFSIDPQELKKTLDGLAEYFNSRFQFYGRRLAISYFDGKGDVLAEFQGSGQEGAEADAVKAAEEIGPFAELLGITAPFSDALSRRRVLNFGAPYMPREWHAARAPYAWSATPDCTFVAKMVSDYLVKRVARRPATRAGKGLQGRPRSLGFITPENPWYQQCADAGERILREAGAPLRLRLSYKLDINTLSNQAASLVAKLRDAEVTTVVCACDPALPIFLTSKAQEQSYEPEWIVPGGAYIDNDAIGQLYQHDQWSRAFGVSFAGAPQPLRGSYGYAAFKAVRPNDEPINLVDLLYYHMYVLALGVQTAGPNLTPESFDAGLHAYPGGSGPMGTWRFTPGRYTPTQDAREVSWDPARTSVVNGKRGAYVETEPGRRYRPGEWPSPQAS